jgi:miniconductance mechanosensitive channel
MNTLKNWLQTQGLNESTVALAAALVAAAVLILVGVIANFVAKRIVLRVVQTIIRRSSVTWDDTFLERKVFERLSHLAPAFVFHLAAPIAFADYPNLVTAVQTGAIVYMAVVGLAVVDGFLNAAQDIYAGFAIARRVPIRGFVQVIKIIVFFAGAIFILSNLLGKSPLVFLSGLGAFTAVLLLVFKDAILGLVAGVQLTANNMVRVGDWIEMPRYGADGDVLEVNLTTVKVQNWNKTISTIPAYALISDSFKNWRGMDESGGRRIKRAVNVDMSSIRFLDEEMLARFKKIEFIQEYLDRKVAEVSAYNREQQVDESSLVNGRRLTNVGTFRAYLEAYLRHHPLIHRDLTFLVRQLAPHEHGLPIEIYVFSRDQAWVKYEAIQSDIFDHVLAVIPLFDLRVFQSPSGADLVRAGEAFAAR